MTPILEGRLNVLKLLWPAIIETLYMVTTATFLTVLIGLPLGILLMITAPKKLWAKPNIYAALSAIVNVTRSFPFIILMIFIMPMTRILVGTAIGTNAAIVPLSLAAIPFFARIVESSLNDIPKGITESALAMGASTPQIIIHFWLPEALPNLTQGVTLTMINLIGYSAMAGTIGGGGLGDLAIRYGYQRFKIDIMISTIIVLITLVQGIQALGNYTSRRIILKRS